MPKKTKEPDRIEVPYVDLPEVAVTYQEAVALNELYEAYSTFAKALAAKYKVWPPCKFVGVK
jgi:hypothetical protein